MADLTRIRTVLVVDDETDHLRLVRVGLNRLGGWTVREASTIAEARASLERDMSDVVLVDYELPDGTGLELAHAVTMMTPSPGVVLMTGHGSEDLAAQALAASVDAYLPKHGNFLGSLGVAVERASREAAARREQLLVAERAVRLRALMYASSAVVRESDPDAVLSAIADQVVATVASDTLGIYLPADGGGFRTCLWRSTEGVPEQDAFPVEMMSRVAQTGRAAHLTAGGKGDASLPDAGVPRSLLLVPLPMGHQGTGMIVLSRRRSPFTEIDREMLEIFGNHVAAALASATMRAVALRRAEHLATIGRATAAVATARSLTQALHQLARGAVDVTGAVAGQVQLYSDDHSSVICRGAVVRGRRMEAKLAEQRAVTTETIAGRLLADGLPVLENDVPDGTAVEALGLLLNDSASALAVAVRSRDRLLGLVLVESNVPYGFSLEHLEALVILCDQAVGAVETTTLLERITRSESLMSAVLRAVPEPVLVTDPDGRLMLWNDAASELFGQPFGSTKPENLERMFGPSQVFDPPTGVEIEAVFYTLDGDTIPVAAVRSPIQQVDGTAQGDVYLLRDLRQERQQREREISLVRTQTVGHMASGVAARLGNVLASVAGSLREGMSLLQEDAAPSDVLPEFARAHDAAVAGGDWLRELQQYSGFERDMELRPVHLATVAREAIELTATQWHDLTRAEGRPVELSTDLDEELAAAGNLLTLIQITMELILNAVDAMPRGGALRLAVRQEAHAVCLDVIDSGDGMSPEVLLQAFDPYFSTRPERSGLGLASCQQLAVGQHGSVAIHSQLGRGTTATIILPKYTASMNTAPFDASGERAAAMRLLVVEDDEQQRELLSNIFAFAGHTIDVVRSVDEALERWQATRYDALVTDVGFVGTSGLDLVRNVRRDRPDVPVLLITGGVPSLTREKLAAEAIERVQILGKPYSVGDVADALQSAVAVAARSSGKGQEVHGHP